MHPLFGLIKFALKYTLRPRAIVSVVVYKFTYLRTGTPNLSIGHLYMVALFVKEFVLTFKLSIGKNKGSSY